MRRVRGLSNATKRLRGFGLALTAGLFAAAIALWVSNAGNSSTQPGSDSRIDYTVRFNTTTTAGQVAQNETASTFPAISTNATWELWVRPMVFPVYGAFMQEAHILAKENAFNFAIWPDGNFYFEF
uniref:hypothetical protein n=1 Tax=Aquiluna sp. TaxID=2053504 RepID=UPI00404709F5